MFRSNGLIDDVLVYGASGDYVQFSDQVNMAISSPEAVVLNSESQVCIEIRKDNKSNKLFTALQNERDEYYSMKDWEARNILRVVGTEVVLKELCTFLKDLSARDEGYSYLSEFSASSRYSSFSPEWRLHVQNT
jgi:hypothetical protein